MRVLLGLAALVASATSVNAQTVSSTGLTVTVSGQAQSTSTALTPNSVGGTGNALLPGAGCSSSSTACSNDAALGLFTINQNTAAGPAATTNLPLNSGTYTSNVILPGAATASAVSYAYTGANQFFVTVPNAVSTIVFTLVTNYFVAQLQYRWYPNYNAAAVGGASANSYLCDPCSGGAGALTSSATACSTSSGPGTSPSPASGYNCALLTRVYTLSNLVATATGVVSTSGAAYVNKFYVQMWDRSPVYNSYSFNVERLAPTVAGDPQIVGMQGQDFQVHGMPDEIFNMITYPNLQVNARFVYLSDAECHDNYTTCFAHPGTYISEEGIRLGKDKIHVVAGSFKKGLTVSINGKKMTENKQAVKLGSVELINHRRVVVKTPIMALTITNSDKFMNQETSLFDQKLLALGQERRVLEDGEEFHPEVPLHGLQGQTWRNVEYPSGLEYEGSIQDYHVTDGNLFGTAFVFNQYKH